MKKFITMLMLTGAALMAQSGSAPATSPSSNATPSDKGTPKVTKKHHKAKKNATTAAPAANAVSNSNTNTAPAKK
jgi:hypothetical protein